MRYSSKRFFTALVFFLGVVFTLSFPENAPVSFSLGPIHINTTISPPAIDLTRLGIPFQKTFETKYGLDVAGGTQVTLEADMSEIKQEDRLDALESAKNVIERRVNFLGLSEPVIQTVVSDNNYRISAELPGITDSQAAIAVIGQTAQLEFREFDELAATGSATPSSLLAITKPSGVGGNDLERANITFNSTTGKPEVAIQFTQEGAKKFEEATKRLIGKPLAIFLDDQIVSSPVVQTEISGGSAVISGDFTQEEAKALSVQLNAGALPVPIHIIERRFVEANLGQESIKKSVTAGSIGLGLVALFMIGLYGRLGFIAVLGLFSYGIITLALYRTIPVTLTLPGIAGFILSIGMAVDSNILIFERYKEEKRAGKPWAVAMELAFGKAWDSIRDANITTIITCVILFNPLNVQFLPTSGMVRGFAVTLLLGVLTSLFTGIIVTRNFIRVLYKERSK